MQALTTSADEYASALDGLTRRMVERSQPFKRIWPQYMVPVLEEGRFVPRQESIGFDKAKREARLFGVSTETPIHVRPLYGYLAEDPFRNRNLRVYGNLVLVFKAEVRQRVSFFFGDTSYAEATCVPLTEPSYRAWTFRFGYPDLSSEMSVDDVEPYAEAQFHGGLALTDISEVIVTEPDFSRLKELSGDRFTRAQRRVIEAEMTKGARKSLPRVLERLEARGIPYSHRSRKPEGL